VLGGSPDWLVYSGGGDRDGSGAVPYVTTAESAVVHNVSSSMTNEML